ncbi:MAG TPA: DMT family transporter [Gemmatimonadota bacterium]|nr:DMT family transporter [Gemmatimonadota bacterium]
MTIGPRPAMVAGVFAMTWAAVLIRWAEAPPLAVAFYRMAFATFMLGVVAAILRVPFWRAWRGVDWWTGAGAATLLALHFGFWITSLEYTTVAASVALVSTQPVFVALIGWAVLRERPGGSAWAGIGLAVAGSVLIAGSDLVFDRRALVGDVLAVLGAVWISIYYVAARWLRATKDLLPYITVIYGFTALVLLAAAATAGAPLTGYDPATWIALLLLALGPTVLGHSALNYALRYLRAYEVNVAILGEPVGAALLALFLLGEAPGPATLLGGGLILAGIFLAQRRRPVRDAVTAANL